MRDTGSIPVRVANKIMLKKITATVCNECGSPAKCFIKKDQHCSGEWNERLEFKCGSMLVYSPNFPANGVTSLAMCERSDEYIAIKDAREAAIDKVLKFAAKQKVDLTFRNRIVEALKNIRA